MPAPQAALNLTERFERNREAFRSGHEQTALQRQIDALVYELGVYPAEPRRMAGDGGRLAPPAAGLWAEKDIGIVEGGG